MKTWPFVCLAAGIVVSLARAQEVSPSSSPPPLPPPPWLKRAPEFSQWTVEYKREQPPVKPGHPITPGSDKKTIQATKTQDIVLETTTRENGAVIQRYCLHGRFIAQVNKTGDWISSMMAGDNGFNDADYVKADFAGFDWISAKNYTGVQAINNRKCLVFQDRVVTMERQELNALRASIEQAGNDWRAEQLRAGADPKNPTGFLPGNNGSASASPKPSKPTAPSRSPPTFNLEDYKVTVTAYVDVDTGMPVALAYKTLQGAKEGRTFVFQDPPTGPLELPSEVQASAAMTRAVSNRMTSRGAVP